MKKIFNKKGSSGFTIIEVTIVLAIAGLIMAIVFVAVPALQRNAHNTQRRSDASHLAGLVNEYSSNHAGTLPTAVSQLNLGGENWSIMDGASTTIVAPGGTASYGSDTQMAIDEGFSCNPDTDVLSATTSDRSFAIGFMVDTSNGTSNSCISD